MSHLNLIFFMPSINVKICGHVCHRENTLTSAESSDLEKMSLHISTFGMRLNNIAKVTSFTELVRKKLPISLQSKNIVDNIAKKSSFSLRILETPKFIKETDEHLRI